MSNDQTDAPAPGLETTRQRYDRALRELTGFADMYLRNKTDSRKFWGAAEENAKKAREHDANAAKALRRCIVALKDLAGVEPLNALRAIAMWDENRALASCPDEPLSPVAEEEWDSEDRASLPQWDDHPEGEGAGQ